MFDRTMEGKHPTINHQRRAQTTHHRTSRLGQLGVRNDHLSRNNLPTPENTKRIHRTLSSNHQAPQEMGRPTILELLQREFLVGRSWTKQLPPLRSVPEERRPHPEDDRKNPCQQHPRSNTHSGTGKSTTQTNPGIQRTVTERRKNR